MNGVSCELITVISRNVRGQGEQCLEFGRTSIAAISLDWSRSASDVGISTGTERILYVVTKGNFYAYSLA